MTYTITKRLEFDAGHRVYKHEGKCAHVHGHRYAVEVTCTAGLDELGRVVDFSVIKNVFGAWIDENLDHGMILYVRDPLVDVFKSCGRCDLVQLMPPHTIVDRVYTSGPQKVFTMSANPTAENIAEMLFKVAAEKLSEHGVSIVEVTVYETPTSRATYRR